MQTVIGKWSLFSAAPIVSGTPSPSRLRSLELVVADAVNDALDALLVGPPSSHEQDQQTGTTSVADPPAKSNVFLPHFLAGFESLNGVDTGFLERSGDAVARELGLNIRNCRTLLLNEGVTLLTAKTALRFGMRNEPGLAAGGMRGASGPRAGFRGAFAGTTRARGDVGILEGGVGKNGGTNISLRVA